MKDIILLGSTGSIGESAVRVAQALPDKLRIVGLAANRNRVRLLEQAAVLGVKRVALADEETARTCAAEAPSDIRVLGGEAGVAELAAGEADVVVCALVGMAGLAPVMAALGQGTDIALATKEVLVSAGNVVTHACASAGAKLLPVDSEHSAIFQCLGGTDGGSVKKLLLTASGGPFSDKPDLDLGTVTIEQVLDHPKWDMGPKVTVDSATLMNKGLEIMEAHWLFGIPVENIEVVVHPESIVHSLVEFVDGNLMAQLSVPDMRFAIQYALTYPERCDGGLPDTDIVEVGALHFGRPDMDRFPCLALARCAAAESGTMPAALNAANEVAVMRFLDRQIPFDGIWRLVEMVMNAHDAVQDPNLDTILQVDTWAREQARTARD